MQILSELRGHEKKLLAASMFTGAVHAENGACSDPRRLLSAKKNLEDAGVPVTPMAHKLAVERALKLAVGRSDYSCFWKLLSPVEGGCLDEADPHHGLSMDSIPAHHKDREDGKDQAAKFQHSWAVDVLVDLFRLESKQDDVRRFLEACPLETLLCQSLSKELQDLVTLLYPEDPEISTATLRELVNKFKTDASLVLHKRWP